jgi:hypothetical protein
VVRIGKLQSLAKYAHTTYHFDTRATSDAQKTTDLELNYVIRDFKARLSLHYLDIKYDNHIAGTDHTAWGLGPQVQM